MIKLTVNGKQVEQTMIDAVIARMQSGEHFRSFEIEGLCASLGADRRSGDAMRIADRIIQRERKAGNINLRKSPQRCWEWIGPLTRISPIPTNQPQPQGDLL